MRGIINIILGVVFIAGGLSGEMVFIGTESGGLLAVAGLGLVGLGGWQATRPKQ